MNDEGSPREMSKEANPLPDVPIVLSGDAYQALFEAMPDAMVVVDGEGRIVLANCRTEELFGYQRQELIGRPVELLLPERYRPTHRRRREEYGRRPRPRPMGLGLELSARDSRGRTFPVEVSLSTIVLDQVRLTAAAIRDVSERKGLEEQLRLHEEYLKLALERSPTTVFNQDAALRYEWVYNPPRGLEDSWFLGRSDRELFPETEAAALVAAKQRVLDEGEAHRCELELSIGGETRHFDLYARPRRDGAGRVDGLTVAMTDMTAQKGVEEALRDLNEDLERLVEQRTEELASANRELREANRERTRLYTALLQAQEQERGRISRDLHDSVGQALTGLLLHLESVIADPRPERIGELKALVLRTLADVRRLSQDLRPALLDELGLEAALKRYGREIAGRSGVAVEVLVHLLVPLRPDQEIALFRIAQEALTNTVRHAAAQRASVVITGSDAGVQLVVEDDGVGFDPRVPGQGLGLLSMRERVELLGGVCQIESAAGGGTSVHVRLPRGPVRPAPS